MRSSVAVAGTLILMALITVPTSAQSDRAGIAARLVTGVLYIRASFGDDDPKSDVKLGFNVGGQFWAPVTRTLGLVFAGVWQPTKVDNPHESIDEAFSALYFLGGVEVAAKSVYLRPSIGVVSQMWSGADVGAGSETSFAPIVGFAIGSERPLGGPFHVSPELELRFSIVAGLSSYLLALQVPIGWRPAREQ